MLSSVVDIVDSSDNATENPSVLTNVRDGVAGFCSMLDSVIDDQERIEDISDYPESSA